MKGDRITLNVGGTRYITTKATLFLVEGFLSSMFSTMKPVADDDGSFFIDRNGRLFESVLIYLQTGELFVPANCTLKLVEAELGFYFPGRKIRANFESALVNGYLFSIIDQLKKQEYEEIEGQQTLVSFRDTVYTDCNGNIFQNNNKMFASRVCFGGMRTYRFNICFSTKNIYFRDFWTARVSNWMTDSLFFWPLMQLVLCNSSEVREQMLRMCDAVDFGYQIDEQVGQIDCSTVHILYFVIAFKFDLNEKLVSTKKAAKGKKRIRKSIKKDKKTQ